jgi:hypothetical protein
MQTRMQTAASALAPCSAATAVTNASEHSNARKHVTRWIAPRIMMHHATTQVAHMSRAWFGNVVFMWSRVKTQSAQTLHMRRKSVKSLGSCRRSSDLLRGGRLHFQLIR